MCSVPIPGSDAAAQFALPPERVWLNSAHQGALPRVAADAVTEMVAWKMAPHHLQTPNAFTDIQDQLRGELAALVGAPPSQIVLANSASYGLHLVANGLPLASGDEVIVAANDFPSDILPWLRLRDQGVQVIQVRPTAAVLTADEVAAAITPRTRAVCLTWVHSFSGHRIDLDAIGAVCRDAGALFVVNGSQGVGAVPLNVADHPIDVLTSVGFKWLVGPYGTGFCWLGERALDRVAATKLYWKTSLTIEDLAAPQLDLEAAIGRNDPRHASRHDIFGTSNFFNYAAWLASVRLIRETGIDSIHQHNLALADQLCDGVDRSRWEIAARSPAAQPTGIVFARPTGEDLGDVADRIRAANVDVAVRSGHVRIAPHLYNTTTDIERCLEAIHI